MTSGGQTYQLARWTGDRTSSAFTITITLNGPTTVRATWSSPGAPGGIAAPVWGLIVLVVAIAWVAAALVQWRHRRRRK